MEDFEGLGSIVAEFNIKESALNLFNIKWKTPRSDKELRNFVQIPYGPHNKAFPSLPLIVSSSGKSIKHISVNKVKDKSILEYDESKFESDFELNETSISTNLTQCMDEYNINDELRQSKDCQKSQIILGKEHKDRDIILESDYEELKLELVEKNSILSSDFTQLSSNRWENKISSEKEELVSLKSEPFGDLELDGSFSLHN